MFTGEHTPRLDDKSRLVLPAKFRDQLADGLVLTKGAENCLYVFPAATFERMVGEMQRAPLTSKDARDYLRVLLSGASDEVPDRQGRITIPPSLRRYASLDREVQVNGAGSRAEIWDRTRWEEYLRTAEESFANRSEEVVPGLF